MSNYVVITHSPVGENNFETHVNMVSGLTNLASFIVSFKNKGFVVLEESYLINTGESNLRYMYDKDGKGVCLVLKSHE